MRARLLLPYASANLHVTLFKPAIGLEGARRGMGEKRTLGVVKNRAEVKPSQLVTT